MAESNVDDNTLISQDDIDKLLNSSSLDGEDSAIDGAEDEMGELSQDDIDRLLNSSSLDGDDLTPDEADSPSDEAEDEMGELSQDDIDRLMNAGTGDDDDSGQTDGPDDGSEDESQAGDDQDLISQEDIDRLMNAGVSDDDSGKPDEPQDEDELELVSQDDIDRLMNDALPDEPEDMISSQDMENLEGSVSEEPDIQEPELQTLEQSPVESDAEPAGEKAIDESEGVAIEDNLITQDVIDALFSQAMDPEPIAEPESIPEPDPEPEPEPEPDFEALLEPEPPPSEVIASDREIAQEDIDDLLGEDEPADDSDENDLISQEDIDALLKSSEEDDEDIIGNLDSGFGGDDDSLDSPDREEAELEDNQVVLEETQEAVSQAIGEELDKVVPATKWYKSKKVMACVMVVILLAASAPVVYFKFFAPGEPTVSSREQAAVVSQPLDSGDTAVESGVATVEIHVPDENKTPTPFMDSGSGTIVLKDFILLIPGKESSLSYLTANVSIDYSNGRALSEINTHLPMYRDIIFDAMGNALGTQKPDKITEADLLGSIKEALNSLLPGKYVDRVSFDAFTTG